jgi:hypothetical protein
MKTFSNIAPLNRKTESYKEQGKKRPLVYRDPDHQKHHESLEVTGNWCESVLVTLTNRPGAPVYAPMWLLKVWRRILRRYDKKRPGETVPYHITANRGESGREQASAHVIFEEEPFPDLTLLQELWEKETGGGFEITTAGHRASLYQSKNATEPDAIEEDYRSKIKMKREEQATPRPPSARKQRRAASDAAWLAENERPRDRSPVANADAVTPLSGVNGADRIDEDIAHGDATPTGSPESGTQSDTAEPGSEPIATGRHTLVELQLEEQEAVECRSWIYRTIKFVHTFRDDQGRRYRWYGANPRPVNLRGYKYPGRYPVLRGVPLTFDANVREIWPDGTASISRPYIRLDRQPEATRRAYAEEYGIPLRELGLEAGGDVIGAESARGRDHRRPAPHRALSDQRCQVQSRSGRYIDERQLRSGSASAYFPEWAEPKVKNR